MDSGDQHTQMSRGYNYIIYRRTVRDWALVDNGDSTHSRKEDMERQCETGLQWAAGISLHRRAEDRQGQKDSVGLGFNGQR